MDKKIILAVAGAGKTTHLISRLDLQERFLVVTYTDNNLENLRVKIIAKFGYLPSNIKLYSYFTFLYSFCYRPFLARRLNSKGIYWDIPEQATSLIPATSRRRYITPNGYLYHNRIAKLLEVEEVDEAVVSRVEKFFDHLLVDEVQDFAGHDFNLLLKIAAADINVLLLGDFFQHTFDTSRDGPTNRTLHDHYEKYLERFKKARLKVDVETLGKSHRCSKSICDFVANQIGIEIKSHNDRESIVKFIEESAEVERLYRCDKTVKLFYQEHSKYGCYSQNWGGSKGQDHYDDVCVILNPTTMKAYAGLLLHELNPKTRNKFYVACTRARRNLYFISDKLLKQFKRAPDG